jgi:hypothetical protein
MPSKTAKQAKFMRAAAHNALFARKAGIAQDVAREFEAADQAKSRNMLLVRREDKRNAS